MSEKNEKKLYFVLIISIIFLLFSISTFVFLFGSYENSTLQNRADFLGLNLILYCVVLFASFFLADIIYND